MDTLDKIKFALKKELPHIEKKYGIKSIGIFGSYIHNIQNENSDLDILVDYFEVPSLLKVIELENYLSDLLKVQVDLVLKSSLKKRIGKKILEEVLVL